MRRNPWSTWVAVLESDNSIVIVAESVKGCPFWRFAADVARRHKGAEITWREDAIRRYPAEVAVWDARDTGMNEGVPA